MPDYKNSFKSPEYLEETIVDAQGGIIGTIRLKPSGLLWKPKGGRKFLSVPLENFIAWISSPVSGARQTSS